MAFSRGAGRYLHPTRPLSVTFLHYTSGFSQSSLKTSPPNPKRRCHTPSPPSEFALLSSSGELFVHIWSNANIHFQMLLKDNNLYFDGILSILMNSTSPVWNYTSPGWRQLLAALQAPLSSGSYVFSQTALQIRMLDFFVSVINSTNCTLLTW